MKRSNVWFALILIASALLLSGAKSVSAQSLGRPSQSLTQQRNETPQQADARTEPSASTPRVGQPPATIDSPSSQPGTKISGENRDQHPCALWQVWKWLSSVSAQGFSNFVIAVATVFLAVFTSQLVVVTRDMETATKATVAAAQAQLDFTKAADEQNLAISKSAAKASEEGVQVSRLALLESRPYLLLTESIQHSGFPRINEVPLHADYLADVNIGSRVRNYGKGPAILLRAVTSAEVVQPDALPPVRDFSRCVNPFLTQEVIEPNGSFYLPNPIFSCGIPDNQITAIIERDLVLIFYGQIEYEDVFKNQFETRFFYLFSLPRDKIAKSETGFFFKAPDDERNFRS